MIQSKYLPLACLLLFLFSGCKKDKTEASIVYPNYSQLKVGNYWVYERYDIDGSGIETASGIIDSCYIEKDTLINGHTYYKRIRPAFLVSTSENPYWRDSLHYIVNSSGEILFSSQNFTDTFKRYAVVGGSDTIATGIVKMDDRDSSISTTAGSFRTSSLKSTIYLRQSRTNPENTRYVDIRYAENVGIVIEGLPIFASNPSHSERRLIRYKVQ